MVNFKLERDCFLIVLLLVNCTYVHAQIGWFRLGFCYGFGSEFNNSDYTYQNRYFKISTDYRLKKGKFLDYELVVQPEINFSKHQLKNLYFITPEELDYQHKREEFSKLKNLHEYVLNLGLRVRKAITTKSSIYLLGSVGPMLIDTETERLSKGFAFSDVLTLGVSFKVEKLSFDINGNVRHTSNGGFQGSNAGFNTFNLEFGTAFSL
ncbi:acyloxyacyl hydrolase [Flavobacterium sp. SM15]|uniref:acyloxyacyl hydrolase n=1 Tax=Flavobacterium sp. SM15 TaxID=2908005 RepID=UPI001EDBB888|nr:acyloxyacyl hydrolase [Flavobacterium sp. SM15]MCG2610420.1 acyloxyacyl hydrolase [Flavobacterium sp. SM15]